jgi:hypothetical protein
MLKYIISIKQGLTYTHIDISESLKDGYNIYIYMRVSTGDTPQERKEQDGMMTSLAWELSLMYLLFSSNVQSLIIPEIPCWTDVRAIA